MKNARCRFNQRGARALTDEEIEAISRQMDGRFSRQETTKPLDKKAYGRILRTAAERAGVSLEGVSTHALRKSFCTRVLPRVGGDLLKMTQLLGDNLNNTQRYVSFLDGSLEAAVLSD